MDIQSALTLRKEWFVESIKKPVSDDYYISREIGRGGYGVIYIAYRKISDAHISHKVAIKFINKGSIEENKKKFQHEVTFLKRLDHPHICKILEIYESETECSIVTEFYEGGEIFAAAQSQHNYDEGYISTLFSQILYGVSYLHAEDIIHQDLKPENILFASAESRNEIKIIDFGLSQYFKGKPFLTDRKGTLAYMSPELLYGKYNLKTDCWSIGVILYFMLTGVHPFAGTDDKDTYLRVYNGYVDLSLPHLNHVSDCAKDLIARLLLKNPNVRISAEQALNHPWIKQAVEIPNNMIAAEIRNNLYKYAQFNRMKRMVITMIATKISENDINYLRESFQRFDQNGDGKLTKEEFEAVFTQSDLILDEEFLDNVWEVVDCNKSGFVDYSEFIAMSMDSRFYSDEYYVMKCFNFLDKKHKRALTISDFVSVLVQHQDDERSKRRRLTGMIQEVAGKDEISLEDFLTLMKNNNYSV